MRARWVFAVAALVAAIAIANGCGGGGGGGSSSSETSATAGSHKEAAGSAEPKQDNTAPAGRSAPAGGGETSGGGEGASEEPKSAGSGTTDKRTFIREASAACRSERAKLTRQLNTYFKGHELKGKSEAEVFSDLIGDVRIPSMEAENRRLSELEPPAGDSAEIESILAEQRHAIEMAKKLATIESQEELEALFTNVDRRLRAYGLGACANTS